MPLDLVIKTSVVRDNFVIKTRNSFLKEPEAEKRGFTLVICLDLQLGQSGIPDEIQKLLQPFPDIADDSKLLWTVVSTSEGHKASD